MTRAITILGLGFTGSLAAYRLAEAGWDVTVIDPYAKRRMHDLVEESPGPTPGTPQSMHLHVLLGRGLELLRSIYPGLDSFLDAARCPVIDWAGDTVWRSPFGLAPNYVSGVRTRSVSRSLLDLFMLSQISRHPQIEYFDATAKKIALENGMTQGVELADGTFHPSTTVLDARGTGSELAADLKLGGIGQDLPVSLAPVALCYRTVVLEGQKHERQYYDQPYPLRQLDGAVMTPIERGLTMLTTIHYPGSELVRRPIEETLATLSEAQFAKSFREASGISKLRSYTFQGCHWRRFGNLAAWPKGLVVIGDAVCRLNPVFGQGMTVAGLCVEALARHLLAGKPLRGFQKTVDRLVALPWHLSSQDHASFAGRLIELGVRSAFASRAVHRRFLSAQHLLRLPRLEEHHS